MHWLLVVIKLNKIFDEISEVIAYQEQQNNITAFFGSDSVQMQLVDSYDIEYEEPEEDMDMTM